MSVSDEERLRLLILELDQLVPRDGASIVIDQLWGRYPEEALVGNDRGYLRFGIEFLKAGMTEKPADAEGPWDVGVDLGYVLSQEWLVVGLNRFVRDDTLDASIRELKQAPIDGKARLKVCCMAVFLLCCVALSCVGLVTCIRWIISWIW